MLRRRGNADLLFNELRDERGGSHGTDGGCIFDPGRTRLESFRQAVLVCASTESVAALGLSSKLEHHPLEMPPRFGAASPLDGMRSVRYVVAKLDKHAAEALRLREGFYVLEKTVMEICQLKSGEKS